MSGLSGAEFVLCGQDGEMITSSERPEAFSALAKEPRESDRRAFTLGRPITVDNRRFFHAAIDLGGASWRQRPATLHMLYPEESYRDAWRHAVYPPLLVGAMAVVLVVAFGLGIASRVTRPLSRLQAQVEEIAGGRFQSLPTPRRDDEIGDLSRSINRMAGVLAHYEDEVRRSEQLRTLGQLGGGIAHQIRNSVTGCRMALDLHGRQCRLQDVQDDESLDVAKRQLDLMERYLRRFLSLGRREAKPFERLNLAEIIDHVVPLVRPTARHVGVDLQQVAAEAPPMVDGDADRLSQVLVNLLLNAIEAAASRCDSPLGGDPSRRVVAQVRTMEGDCVRLEVLDSGPGPAESVQHRVFEPLVSEKPDGVGLGLSIAREVIEDHGGSIDWRRQDGMTCFAVTLPQAT
jgi:signal transduction histidine kinase